MAAEPVALLERPAGAVVLVDFVAGDDDDALERAQLSAGLQQRAGAEDIGGVGAERIAVGFAHQRLRRHVNDDLRIGAADRGIADPRGIANVADDRGVPLAAHDVPEIRGARRRERIARDLRTQRAQPQAQPAPLNPVCPVIRTRRPRQNSCR